MREGRCGYAEIEAVRGDEHAIRRSDSSERPCTEPGFPRPGASGSGHAGRARDQDQWLRDSKLLAEAGAAALKFAKAKDVEGIVGLNEQLVASCTSCHMHYRSNYGRRRGAAPPQTPPQSPPPQ